MRLYINKTQIYLIAQTVIAALVLLLCPLDSTTKQVIAAIVGGAELALLVLSLRQPKVRTFEEDDI